MGQRRLRAAVLVVGSFVLALVLAFATLKVNPGLLGTSGDERNTQIVNAVTREEKVVLLSLGIQGIAEKTGNTTFLGVEVPGSNRALFIQYAFNAQLGVDGAQVRITDQGDNRYLLSVPRFVFIGHDDVTFRMAAQNNGVLSWVTPEINTLDMVNSILNDKAKDRYLEANRQALRDQTQAFYSRIITGIRPDAMVQFEFAE